MTAKADGAEVSQRLSKIETAISRRKTIEFTYYTIERDSQEKRKVDPYHLVYRGGQFYLIGHSHERDAIRVFRLSRIRGKVSYASKAEHDFSPPEDFERRDYARKAEWQLGEIQGTAKIFLKDRVAWLVERDFGAYGEFRNPGRGDGSPGKGRIFETEYASSRQMVAWVLHWRQNATVLDPPELAEEVAERLELLSERHSDDFESGRGRSGPCRRRRASARSNGRSDIVDPAGALRAPGDAGRDADRVRQGRGPPPGRRRQGSPARQRGGAPRRHRPAQRRQLRRRAPTSSTPSCRATRSRSTPSPTATTSPSPPGCCRSRRRRWSPRSTCSATTCRRAAWSAPGRRSSPRSATIPPRRASRSPPRAATTPTSPAR